LFRNQNIDRLVAERLRGEDFRKEFVTNVIASMKEHPEEWEVEGATAKHLRGVEVDCRNPEVHNRVTTSEQLQGFVTKPAHVCLSDAEMSALGDAFDYLAKLKILRTLRMDKK
jgi:hypothetical protein